MHIAAHGSVRRPACAHATSIHAVCACACACVCVRATKKVGLSLVGMLSVCGRVHVRKRMLVPSVLAVMSSANMASSGIACKTRTKWTLGMLLMNI